MKNLNKGIGTSLTDPTNIITYNYLNLPETVTKGGNSVRYIYDATGRKLSQVTTFGGQQKQTDYVGEFQYENDALQFISHEEGRIAIANTKTIVTHAGDALTNITAATSTLATVTLNGSTYVRATANGTTAKQGMFPIGSGLAVTGGEQYRIRAKGYRTGASAVYLYIRTNSTDLNWPGAQLSNSATTEAYSEQVITIPTGHTVLEAGVVWNTVAGGEQFFLNDFEITKLSTNATPEYQYNLKDHLGNVRLTFTTKDEIETTTATLETANLNLEQSQFLRINMAKRINSSIFDHTNGSAPTTILGYAERLNGGTNERYGVAKSISVMPGDVINAEVYAKYVDQAGIDGNTAAGQALLALLGQISQGAAGVVIDGAAYSSSTVSFPATYPSYVSKADNGAPRAYLNWLVFDRNFTFITGGYKPITTAAREVGTDVPHERIFNTDPILITQPGYVYIYLSNENPSPVEVYFDDFKVTHTKSPVIQQDNYYPFGLTFNSYQRENSVANNYLYNGKELQDELGLNWEDYGARMYIPEIGRWGVVDAFSTKAPEWSPYRYGFDNPIRYRDENGDFEMDPKLQEQYKRIASYLKSGIQGIAKNDKIVNALMKYGQFSKRDIEDGLKWGSGPKIRIADKSLAGRVFTDKDYGSFIERIDPKVITINEYWAKKLESATGSDKEALLFLIAVTILHEYTHYGDNLDGINYTGSVGAGEEGNAFEIEAYGQTILGSNALKIIEQWKKDQEKTKEEQQQEDKKRKATTSFLSNPSSLEGGTYTWDGEAWVKK